MEYIRGAGVQFSNEDRIRADQWEHFYFANSPEIQEDNKIFKEDIKAFWLNFTKRRLITLGIQSVEAVELAPKVSAYMDEFYKPEVYVPQEAFTTLPALKDAGYMLGVVSNRDEPFQQELVNLNIDSYFQFSLAGGEVNSFKPDVIIFERALELAGTSALETMYIGDNYFADVVGSRRAGLKPVLYDPGTVFPEADCAVIRSFAELPELLK